MSRNQHVFSLILLSLMLVIPDPSPAHNGAIVLAHPIDDITIDGDLSDWPRSVDSHPLEHVLTINRDESPDLIGGSFRIGYSPIDHALFIAVESPTNWNAEDGACVVFLEALHRDRKAYALSYTLGKDEIEKRGYRSTHLPALGVEAKMLHIGNRSYYEWSIAVENIAQKNVLLEPGTTLAFDLILKGAPVGSNKAVRLSWGPGMRKNKLADRRGDLLIIGRNQETGTLAGRISLPEALEPTWHNAHRLTIQSTDTHLIRLDGRWNDEGLFANELPAGRYEISASMNPDGSDDDFLSQGTLRIEPNRTTVASLPMHKAVSDAEDKKAGLVKAGSGTREGRWHSFKVPDGLPTDEILALALRPNGDLWLGTGKGAVRFDGDNMQIFTTEQGLADNTVRSIAVDPNGYVWFGTSNGLSRYDGKTFKTFSETDGLPSDKIETLFVDEAGELYVGTDRGLSQYNRRIMTRFTSGEGLPSHRVSCMLEDRQGRHWFGIDNSLCQYNNGLFDCIEFEIGEVSTLAEDHRGTLWLSGFDELYTFDGEQITLIDPPIEGLYDPRAIAGQKGDIWIDYQNDEGSYTYRYKGKTFERLGKLSGMELADTQTIGPDQDGNIWFNSDRGLVAYNGSDYTVFTREDGLASHHINFLYQSRNRNLWFETQGNGVARLSDGQFQRFNENDGLSDDWVYDIAEGRDGAMWFATASMASRFFRGRFDHPISLPQSRVLSIEKDREKNLWFHTGRNITRYDGETVDTLDEEEGLDGEEPVIFFAVDNSGFPWFAQENAGVFRYNGSQFIKPREEIALGSLEVLNGLVDRRDALWLGTSTGIFHYQSGQLTHFTTADGLPSDQVSVVFEDSGGKIWSGTNKGVGYFEQGRFIAVSTDLDISSIVEGEEDQIWFGTAQGQILLFDGIGVELIRSRPSIGATPSRLAFDHEKNLWLGTGNGLMRYEGDQLTTFMAGVEFHNILEDSAGNLFFFSHDKIALSTDGENLAELDIPQSLDPESAIADRDGTIWVGGENSIYSVVENRLTAHPLPSSTPNGRVRPLYADPEGGIWISTDSEIGRLVNGDYRPKRMGDEKIIAVHRDYEGQLWTAGDDGRIIRRSNTELVDYTFALVEKNNSNDNTEISFIDEDKTSFLWVGTNRGLGRFEAGHFRSYTENDGLGTNNISSMHEDSTGSLWFATDMGISHFKDGIFTNYDQTNGLAYDKVNCISEDREGHLWIGTHGGGVSQYDGLVFQSLRARDGLAHNTVHSIHQDTQGDLWFATQAGITRYRPRASRPTVSAWSDTSRTLYALESEKVYQLSEDVRFGFDGVSLKTRPDQIAYAYRLVGHQEEWKWTRKHEIVYKDLPVGEYQFEVQAVDRDLNYSQIPAIVPIKVQFNYWVAFSGAAIVIGLIAAVYTTVSNRLKFRRAEQARIQAMEEELNKAHDLQMGLMPSADPEWNNLKVAGRCRPATEVGGDIYQFFEGSSTRSCILADVTGHGMEAAVPAIVFDGVIHTEITSGQSQEALFNRLNTLLYSRVNQRTFICCSMVSIDSDARNIQLINAGLPYPLHYKSKIDQVEEVVMDAFPLALRETSEYRWKHIAVEPGDRIVLCSDGLIEVENDLNKMFGFEGFADTIQETCSARLAPQEIIDRVYETVAAYDSASEQLDDQTMIVIEIV